MPPSYYQEDAPISPTGSQNKTTAADNNINNNNDDTETTETHKNERNVGKEDMDRDEPHKQWWKLPNNRKGLLVWTAVALLLAFWSWSMSAGDARRSLMIANSPSPKQERILYIITTLAEYNSGTRKTVKGSDRYVVACIPVIRCQSHHESFVSNNYNPNNGSHDDSFLFRSLVYKKHSFLSCPRVSKPCSMPDTRSMSFWSVTLFSARNAMSWYGPPYRNPWGWSIGTRPHPWGTTRARIPSQNCKTGRCIWPDNIDLSLRIN